MFVVAATGLAAVLALCIAVIERRNPLSRAAFLSLSMAFGIVAYWMRNVDQDYVIRWASGMFAAAMYCQLLRYRKRQH